MHTPSQTLLRMLSVERTGVPIYIQLRDQVLAAIGAGILSPEDRMPTMREVAVALRVDLNTVRHAYEDLERAGAIVLRRGLGSFVAAAPPPAPSAERERALDDLAARSLALARAAGLDPAALARRILDLVEPKKGIAT